MRRFFLPVSALILLSGLGCFFVYPLLRVVQGGFVDEAGHFTLAYLVEAFRNPIYVEGLRNSFLLAVATTFLVVLMALPMAMLNARFNYPGKALFSALILVPMILPPFVGAIGFRQFWGQYGVFNALLENVGLAPEVPIDWLGISRFWGVAFAQALHLYPILYLNVVAALANLDPSMEEAARNLGAGRWRRLRQITLPLIRPGLFAGGTLVFIWAFTELGTPLMFDYARVTPVQVFDSLKEIGDNPFAYVLVVILLTASVGLYFVGKAVFGSVGYATQSRAMRGSADIPLSGTSGFLALAAMTAVTAVALVPHVCVVLMSVSEDWYNSILPQRWSLDPYRDALGHTFTVPSIGNSLRYAGIATMIDVVLGCAVAWILVRTKWMGRGLLDGLVMAPLAVPGIVLAFGYLAMTQPGEWFAFLDPTDDPTFLLIIAYAIRRLPYMVRAAVAGLEQASVTLEEAARNLGAGPLRTIRLITLPLISANLIAGGILTFCFAMLEVSDSLMLAQRQSDFPITKAIFELYQLLGEGRVLAAALGTWSMAFLASGLLLASLLLGKKMGRLFRV